MIDFEQWYEQEIGSENKPEYEAAKWAWNYQQAKIDELQEQLRIEREQGTEYFTDTHSLISERDELQARIDSLTNINESLVAYKNQLLDELEEKGNKDD